MNYTNLQPKNFKSFATFESFRKGSRGFSTFERTHSLLDGMSLQQKRKGSHFFFVPFCSVLWIVYMRKPFESSKRLVRNLQSRLTMFSQNNTRYRSKRSNHMQTLPKGVYLCSKSVHRFSFSHIFCLGCTIPKSAQIHGQSRCLQKCLCIFCNCWVKQRFASFEARTNVFSRWTHLFPHLAQKIWNL